jgi:uncharacterized repeat protein (TIGR01451 family)
MVNQTGGGGRITRLSVIVIITLAMLALGAGVAAAMSPVPYFSQCDSLWSSDQLGGDGPTICDSGCALTSAAMVMAYYGVDTDPQRLNNAIGRGGYDANYQIFWSTVRNACHDETNQIEYSPGTVDFDTTVLNNHLDAGHPVIVKVYCPGYGGYWGNHFVVVTGRSGDTYPINDPASSTRSTLDEYPTRYGMRIFSGVPVSGRSDGPDSFGYTFVDSNTPDGPSCDWIEISDTGTAVLTNSDDSWIENINIGFFFNYYGTDYSQLAISNNGLLFSGVGTWQYINQPITQTPNVHGFIAPYWDDIVTWGSADAIYYKTLGTAPNRMFVVEWHDNQHYSSSTSGITFEAILYEGTNNIKFQYKDVDFGNVYGAVGGDNPPYNNGGSATVGIEGPTGDVGLQYSFNEQVIDPGLAILFKFPQFAGTNLYLSKQAPASKDRGSTMTYTMHYHNFGDTAAQNVVLEDTVPAEVEFVSASEGGGYDSNTRKVTWDIGSVAPNGHGYETVTVRISQSVQIGTVIQNDASISTSNLEVRYDDNEAHAQTRVTGSNLPPDVGVEPNNGGTGTPSIYWHNPITFSYHSSDTATGVDIRIHVNDGGPDITGSMTGGPPDWTYTTTFYPRHGRATVTYTVSGESCQAATTPTLPSTIRVLRTETGQVEVVDLKEYVKNVLPNEWISSWNMDALKSGAMATKTYAWYWTIHQKYPGCDYDVKDTIADQVYRPSTANSRTSQAVEETWNWVVTKNGEIFQAQYDSGTQGSPDPLNAGRMSQWGTQYWAESGKDWLWIVHYYYDPVEGPCVPSVTFDIYIDPAGYIYNVDTGERIAGATVWLQRPDGEGGWENVPTGETPPIAQPDVNPLITGTDGQYQWDVLEGSYRVHVEAPDYYPADSIVVSIPPPVTDLHVGLTHVPQPPVADADGPYTGYVGSPITFDGTSSYDLDGVIVSYEWDLDGDGEFDDATGPTPSETWSTPYSGIIRLVVTDDDGEIDIDETTLTVEEAVDTEPPTIESVTLDAYTTIPDATIHVTVEATDNVEVTAVTADGVALVETEGTWQGDITAPSATGSYTLTIRAEDAAGNFAETTVDYSVVIPTGGLGIAVLPKKSSATAGSTLPLDIKVVSTENFDDVLHVYLTLEGIPAEYQADLTWFSWTDTTVQIPAGGEIMLPVEERIPVGVSGLKYCYAKVESTNWNSDAKDWGRVDVTP